MTSNVAFMDCLSVDGTKEWPPAVKFLLATVTVEKPASVVASQRNAPHRMISPTPASAFSDMATIVGIRTPMPAGWLVAVIYSTQTLFPGLYQRQKPKNTDNTLNPNQEITRPITLNPKDHTSEILLQSMSRQEWRLFLLMLLV